MNNPKAKYMNLKSQNSRVMTLESQEVVLEYSRDIHILTVPLGCPIFNNRASLKPFYEKTHWEKNPSKGKRVHRF